MTETKAQYLVDALGEAAEETVSWLVDRAAKVETTGLRVVSGRGEEYELDSLHTFETSVVENLIRNLSEKKTGTLGWESAYPDNYPGWSRCRLDLGLGQVTETGEKHLFEVAVEVKLLRFDSAIKSTALNSIFGDLFKLCGYQHEDQRVGHRRVALVFFSFSPGGHGPDPISILKENFEKPKAFLESISCNSFTKYITGPLGWKADDLEPVKSLLGPAALEGNRQFLGLIPNGHAVKTLESGDILGFLVLEVLPEP